MMLTVKSLSCSLLPRLFYMKFLHCSFVLLACEFKNLLIVKQVIDACAAPGNKTVHLAALMKGKGRIHACEVDSKRVLRLRETVSRAGASSIQRTEYFLH